MFSHVRIKSDAANEQSTAANDAELQKLYAKITARCPNQKLNEETKVSKSDTPAKIPNPFLKFRAGSDSESEESVAADDEQPRVCTSSCILVRFTALA